MADSNDLSLPTLTNELVIQYLNQLTEKTWVKGSQIGGSSIIDNIMYYGTLENFSENYFDNIIQKCNMKFQPWTFTYKQDTYTDYFGCCPCCAYPEDVVVIEIYKPENNTPEAIKKWGDDFVNHIKKVNDDIKK